MRATAIFCSVALAACAHSSGSAPTTDAVVSSTDAVVSFTTATLPQVGWAAPPTNAGFDYQLGGDYPPPDGVTVVTRDVTGSPAPGTYGICYVNAFQTQPGERSAWPDGSVTDFEDPGFPDEYLVDISTASKRELAAGFLAPQIDSCADKGFSAVEFDNLDSWTRLDGTELEGELAFGIDDATDFVRRLAAMAHRRGLAVGQKNTAEFGARRVAEVGFDFVVSEECAQFEECDRYQEVYGDRIIDIEYDRSAFEAACAGVGRRISVVFRDVEVSPPGSATYMFATC